jgi:ATP phosphoribosyltransferase regulatory subunit
MRVFSKTVPMSRAWLLPEHIADILPAEAARVEQVRRQLLDQAGRRGFELIIPPLLEHLESLLSGTGRELELQTFTLVDQLSGRLLGLRADTTPQAARIDAHLLNRSGMTRLCYCGPVLHTRPGGAGASREPLQFGAEIFGHAGLEAEMEVLDLALEAVAEAGVAQPVIDLADARILRGVLAGVALDAVGLNDIVEALSRKDAAALDVLTGELPEAAHAGLRFLLGAYGGVDILNQARAALPARALIGQALDDLCRLATHLQRSHPGVRVGFDLADMGGYAYYSGVRFAMYAQGASQALARGGRYDEVGAVFGRNRPAVGFSLDVKSLAQRLSSAVPAGAVRASWSDSPEFAAAVRRLRDAGETVVIDLPGSSAEECGRTFDRVLEQAAGRWVLRSL